MRLRKAAFRRKDMGGLNTHFAIVNGMLINPKVQIGLFSLSELEYNWKPDCWQTLGRLSASGPLSLGPK